MLAGYSPSARYEGYCNPPVRKTFSTSPANPIIQNPTWTTMATRPSPTLSTSAADRLEVTEDGYALKVRTDEPHLVSLGSGRLSTAVTIHPLPEGRTVLGCGGGGGWNTDPFNQSLEQPDILVNGTGVEAIHCYIENDQSISGSSIVILYPLAEMISVDGVKVTSPMRLTQGCMLCIGRSNYFRFNHPQEAQLMKTILPNTRISGVPINFYPGMDNPEYFHMNGNNRDRDQPPLPPQRQQGLVPVRPAPVHPIRTEDLLAELAELEHITSPRYQDLPRPPVQRSWDKRSRQSPSFVPVHPPRPASPPFDQPQTPQYIGEYLHPRTLNFRDESPSPRNVPPVTLASSPKVFTPNTPTTNVPASSVLRGRSATPTGPAPPLPSMGHKRNHSTGGGAARCITPSSYLRKQGSQCSLEELAACEEELREKRRQAQEERMREQETEKVERARLDEILNMCAEYEKQVEEEKKQGLRKKSGASDSGSGLVVPPHKSASENGSEMTTMELLSVHGNLKDKPPLSPGHVLLPHPNRIKTNGSLPRDKRVPSPSNSRTKLLASSEDELNRIFNPESSTPFSHSAAYEHHSNTHANSVTPLFTSQTLPRPSPSSNICQSPYENVTSPTQLTTSASSYFTYPHSPRTRIKTTFNRDNNNSSSLVRTPEDSNDKMKLANHSHVESELVSYKSNSSLSVLLINGNVVRSPEGATEPILAPPKQSSDKSPGVASVDGAESVFGETDMVVVPDGSRVDNSVAENAADLEALKSQVQYLVAERKRILCVLATLKSRLLETENQVDEAVRELEMEKALLVGEKESQKERLLHDEKQISKLQEQDKELDKSMELWRKCEEEKIAEARLRMDDAERELNRLEKETEHFTGNADEETALLEKLKHQHEVLEAERKAFEDLEFHLMEGIAHREEERENVHREMANLELKLLQRKQSVKDLQDQQKQGAETARREALELETRRAKLFKDIEQERTKLATLQSQLEELLRKGGPELSSSSNSLDSMAEYSSDPDEGNAQEVEKRLHELRRLGHSQDDLDRIEKVATSSQFDTAGTLGRKTSATLQEIERNRQMILVKQGTQVLEHERRRVAELKRRVQDEVKQQWEEKKQQDRELNCQSLNSVGSEESSATSSDLPPESVSSEDALRTSTTTSTTPCPDNVSMPSVSITSILEVKVRQKEQELSQALEDCRPLSDASSFGDEIPSEVRLRERGRTQQQRPLTRYLPVRSERFDLRQHIETAGHQIELCTHVTLTATSARGYLHKMGSKFRTWNKRWFVFDRMKRTFMYFADKSETKVRGGAYFQSIEEVYVDHLHSVKSPNPKLTFCVKTYDRTYHLMAPSAEAMRIWVDVIFTGAEGYQEFQHVS